MELTSGLTLQKAIKMVKQTEQVEMESRERSLDDKQTEEIKQVRHGSGHYRGEVPNRSRAPRGRGHNRSQQKPPDRKMCGRCGKEHGRRCPTSGQQCHMCKKISHFASVCRGRQRSAQEVQTQLSSMILTKQKNIGSTYWQILRIDRTTLQQKQEWFAEIDSTYSQHRGKVLKI